MAKAPEKKPQYEAVLSFSMDEWKQALRRVRHQQCKMVEGILHSFPDVDIDDVMVAAADIARLDILANVCIRVLDKR
jgi:ribosomal protein L16 Arg81 hydroxylase